MRIWRSTSVLSRGDSRVFGEPVERLTLVVEVADALAQRVGGRAPAFEGGCPTKELVEQRLAALLAELEPQLGAVATHVGDLLHGIDELEELQRSHRLGVGVEERDELAPGMGEAADLDCVGDAVLPLTEDEGRPLKLDEGIASSGRSPERWPSPRVAGVGHAR